MRDKGSLVHGWLRKAQSDRVAMEASFGAGALDVACFHAQQVVEKCLKAFLVHAGKDFPFTHNLSKLVAACAGLDASFQSLLTLVEPLTPYAVELRYDAGARRAKGFPHCGDEPAHDGARHRGNLEGSRGGGEIQEWAGRWFDRDCR